MTRNVLTTKSTNWAVEVASRMRGVAFPLEEEDARRLLEGVSVEGQSITVYLDNIDFPLATPAQLLHEISKQTGAKREVSTADWPLTVAKAAKSINFPLDLETAKEELFDIGIDNTDIGVLLPRLRYPIESPIDLLEQLHQNID
jgi:predicted transcriptional regulator